MQYTVIEKPHLPTDLHPIQLEEGEFAGCQVIYGGINITEEGTLKFDYNIVNDYNVSKDKMPELVQTLGDLLVQLIDESMEKGETIYKGGQ